MVGETSFIGCNMVRERLTKPAENESYPRQQYQRSENASARDVKTDGNIKQRNSP
jgi:hypothetical protein